MGQGRCRQVGAEPALRPWALRRRELPRSKAWVGCPLGCFVVEALPQQAGTLRPTWPPAWGGLGLPRLGRVGVSQPGETEAPIRHAVTP